MPPGGSRTSAARRPPPRASRYAGESRTRHVGAVADVRERILERERARTATWFGQPGLEPLEQPERLERGDALRRRRQLEHLDAAVVEPRAARPSAARSRRGPPRSSQRRRGDRPRDRAARRTRPGPSLGDRAERRRRARAGGPARRARRRAAPSSSGAVAASPHAPAAWRRDREAALGGVDRVGEARVEAEPAEPLGERRPAGDRAGNGDRARARARRPARAVGRRRAPARPRPARRPRRRARRSRTVAADAGRHRLGHAEHRGGGERRVGRVAAALERPQPGPDRASAGSSRPSLRARPRADATARSGTSSQTSSCACVS